MKNLSRTIQTVKRSAAKAAFAAFFLFAAADLWANNVLTATVWSELQPAAGAKNAPLLPPALFDQQAKIVDAQLLPAYQKARDQSRILALQIRDEQERQMLQALLAEAVWIFSGMIYGFEVNYTPSDKVREQAEIFTLEPVFWLKWGDPRLKARSGYLKEGRYYCDFSYTVGPGQISRRKFWRSNVYPSATGTGGAELIQGRTSKILSQKRAVKNALRGYLRSRTFNKPYRVTGQVWLKQAPLVGIVAGAYRSTVQVKLNINFDPYRLY